MTKETKKEKITTNQKLAFEYRPFLTHTPEKNLIWI